MSPASIYHLIRADEQCRWHGEAKRLCGIEVDDELNVRGKFHWQIGWAGALEQSVNKRHKMTEKIDLLRSLPEGRGSKTPTIDQVLRL
jgi:hypothetical protein